MEDPDNSSIEGSAIPDCDINVTLALHTHWIYMSFGTCVVNGRQYLSFFVGLVSLLSWICAQLPQLVVNCKTGEADKSLSFSFLLLWMFSDSANFLGAVLTNQVIIVVLLGAYFVLIEIIFIVQFIFHFIRNRGLQGLKDVFTLKQKAKHLNNSIKSCDSIQQTTLVFLFPCGMLIMLYRLFPQHSYDTGQWKGRTLLGEEEQEIIDSSDTKFLLGYILGWVSAVIYSIALPPQIIKNFKRKSVSGLSLTTFVLIAMGDFTYFLSIILFSVEKVFIIRSLPWLAGAAWSVFFDVFLVIQIMVYRYLDRCHRHSRELAILMKETTV